MVIYPVPAAVTQAKIQLVIDETAKAPATVINSDVQALVDAQRRPSRRHWSTSRPSDRAASRMAGNGSGVMEISGEPRNRYFSVVTWRTDDVSSAHWFEALDVLSAQQRKPTDADCCLGGCDHRDDFDGGAGSRPDL